MLLPDSHVGPAQVRRRNKIGAEEREGGREGGRERERLRGRPPLGGVECGGRKERDSEREREREREREKEREN